MAWNIFQISIFCINHQADADTPGINYRVIICYREGIWHARRRNLHKTRVSTHFAIGPPYKFIKSGKLSSGWVVGHRKGGVAARGTPHPKYISCLGLVRILRSAYFLLLEIRQMRSVTTLLTDWRTRFRHHISGPVCRAQPRLADCTLLIKH